MDYASKRGARPDLEGIQHTFGFPPIQQDELLSRIEEIMGNATVFPEAKDLTPVKREHWLRRALAKITSSQA